VIIHSGDGDISRSAPNYTSGLREPFEQPPLALAQQHSAELGER
jgi:hypothetical protein